MAQVTVAQVADLTVAVLAQARCLYKIQQADRNARVHITPMQLAATLDREVSVEEVAAANKAAKLDAKAAAASYAETNRELIAAWEALIPENATAGSKLRISRIVARIVRMNRAVDPELLARDIRAVCNMNY